MTQGVQFSSVPCLIGSSLGGGDTRYDSAEIHFQFWHGQICPFFDVVHPAFPLPTIALSTVQSALKDGFGEAVEACDVAKPCKFLSLDSSQKRFLQTHMEVDFAPHPVIGLMLQVGG